MISLTLILIAVVVLFVVAFILSGIRIIPEYQRLVVLRLGRYIGVRGPGLTYLIPLIDRGIMVDLRENYIEVPHQTCITKDNAPTDIDFLIYYRVFDPERLSLIHI